MSDDFLDNLTSLTDNLNDIAFSRYVTVTNINDDNIINCKEDNGTIHKNVINGTKFQLSVDDIVTLYFVDNDIYQPIIIGGVQVQKTDVDINIVTEWEDVLSDNKVPSEKLTKNSIDNKQDALISGTNIKTINHNSLLGSGNITIQGGGGSVIGTGSFSIDNNGHLIVELPDGVDNPYYINNNGHLIYDTSNTHNGD